MKLKKLFLKNFRGYQEDIFIDIDSNLTAFLGKNDVGKSTILEALEIFFNSEQVKMEADDLNIYSGLNEVIIGCIFKDLPNQVIVDSSHPTSFSKEYLTNLDGDLFVIKKYKIQSSVGKPSTYLLANYPTEDKINNLHELKIVDLKKLGKELGVENNVADHRISSLWREAIWNNFSELKLSLKEIDISKFSSDSKGIIEKIEQVMPTFALFKSDRGSSDGDPEAKNPMQTAVKQAQKRLEKYISKIQQRIEKSVLDVANRTVEKIKEMDPGLAKELKPRLKEPPKWTFNFTIDGDENIPINKRGSGIRRLILLNFFRAEVEKKHIDSNTPDVIYAIEEPETSQHPNYQKLLIDSLLNLSLRPDCQIIITTHVPSLAELLPINGIRFIKKGDDKKVEIFNASEEILEEASKSLGVLPEPAIIYAKAVVLVEGHSDITFWNHISEKFKGANIFKESLSDKKIYLIPIGGCGNLKHWVTKKVIDKLGLNWCVILDSDIGDNINNLKNIQEINNIKLSGKKGFLTRKREPENYIDPDIILKKNNIPITYSDTDDAKNIIGTAITMRGEHVLEKIWPRMEFANMQKMSNYQENSITKNEFSELLNEFFSLV